jgi:hypothetical protein
VGRASGLLGWSHALQRGEANRRGRLCTAVLLVSVAADATARMRTAPPGGTFRLANHAVIDQVRIKNGQVLRVRCIGDGCDWRRKRKPKILANISELDRIFRSFARMPLVVTTRPR